MNEVFLIGKIISKIEYRFMMEKNKTARVEFRIKLLDMTEIELIGYNEIADFCFSKLGEKDCVIIYGCISNNKIEIKRIEVFGTFSHFKS